MSSERKKLLIEKHRLLIQKLRRICPPKLKKLWKSRHRYIFAWSGRAFGKSVTVIKMLLDRCDQEKLKVLCTREVQISIKDSIYSEIKEQISECEYLNYEATENSIRNKVTGSEFLFQGLQRQDIRQTIKGFTGVDICLVEEAQCITKGSLDILVPTIRKKGSQIIFLFNRLLPEDAVWRFKNSRNKATKLEIYGTYKDNPCCTPEIREMAELSKAEWKTGKNNDYPHIWLGEPQQDANDTVLNFHELKKATERKIDDAGDFSIGADIARFGDDKTVFAKRKGLKLTEIKIYAKLSVIECAKKLAEFAGDTTVPIKVDDTGVGGGVTDWLMDVGYNVVPINFGSAPNNKTKYSNKITEIWYEFKKLLPEIELIDDIDAINELSARRYSIDERQRKVIEKKADLKKRLGRSPDRADAILLCYHNQGAPAQFFDGVI